MKIFSNISSLNELIYPNIVMIGCSQHKTTQYQILPYYFWVQTIQDSGIIEINQNTYSLQKNDGILISPFIPHKYHKNKLWITNRISICGYATTFFPRLLGVEKFYIIRSAEDVLIEITSLTELLEKKKPTKEISKKTYNIFFEIRKKLIIKNNSTDFFSPSYLEIKKFIDENYQKKISIVNISKQYNTSPQYVIRLFKKYIGISPYQYLLKKRIQESKNLLLSNNSLLISEVAYLVGFDSTSHFIKLFKKQENCTPKEFQSFFFNSSDHK